MEDDPFIEDEIKRLLKTDEYKELIKDKKKTKEGVRDKRIGPVEKSVTIKSKEQFIKTWNACPNYKVMSIKTGRSQSSIYTTVKTLREMGYSLEPAKKVWIVIDNH